MNFIRAHLFTVLIVICVVGIVACAGYFAYNYWYLPRSIEADNQRYAQLYDPEDAQSTGASAETPAHTETPFPAGTPEPAETPSAVGTAAPAGPDMPGAPDDILLGTPGPDTLIYALPTPPPVQASFSALLGVNPETVGFLKLGDKLALPVVQRENDNNFYLEHNFEGEESVSGCLFLDGANWLFPQDDCLYVYGHNMRNGSMFGKLTRLADPEELVAASPAQFDTIYENSTYIPFACIELTTDESSQSFFSLRRFAFTEMEFDSFVNTLKSRSLLDIPVEVEYGDRLLILVTCDYNISDGRFAVAYRQIREGESVDDAMEQVRMATAE